jgi:hypothetical protein
MLFGAASTAPAIPAPESTLGSHPCVALSFAQVFPEWKISTLPCNDFSLNGNYPLNWLSHATGSLQALNAYIARRQKEGRKNATINRELAILRRAFRLGYEHDPQLVFRVPVIKALKEDNVREGFLEADKYHVLLEALSEYVKPVFVVAYHLGMRTVNCLR